MGRNVTTGKNESCSCGSGKKFKKCCMRKSEKKIFDTDNLTVELSDKNDANKAMTLVARSVLSVFNEILPVQLPAGTRRMLVRYYHKEPRVDPTQDEHCYYIYVTTRDLEYNQFVFQLAHELGHIYADPRRSSWFVESCCEMFSIELLNRIQHIWSKSTSPKHWIDYAHHFRDYLRKHINNASQRLFGSSKLPDRDYLTTWLKNKLKESNDPHDRLRNLITAEIMRPLFNENINNWKSIAYLGKASSFPPSAWNEWDQNFSIQFESSKWLEVVPKEHKEFVSKIIDTLGMGER